VPDRSRALLALAFLVLAAAVVRLPLFAALDPLRVAWGSEGGDLAALLAAHDWARSRTDGSLPFGLLTYKPPLYYVGVPWLLSGAERLRWVGLLSVNAAALAVAGAAAAVSARRLAGAPAGALAVLVFCLLPGVEGRFTYAGVEPLQTALLGLALALSIDVLVRGGSVLRGAALGAVCGAGMLVKWTFAFPLLGPAVVAVAVVRDRARIRALLVALVVAASLFLAWALPFLDVSQLVENAPLEGVDDTWGDLASTIGCSWPRSPWPGSWRPGAGGASRCGSPRTRRTCASRRPALEPLPPRIRFGLPPSSSSPPPRPSSRSTC
jgi:4-amino-4-deoxy-L-arabinose transferase-like glycosyltransferase